MTLKSKQFNDVYFSADDGLAETRHVFLAGNNLPHIWKDYVGHDFTICETGFGTGLNFLAVWKLWNETPENARPSNLNFISFEKYPLSQSDIEGGLSNWSDDLGFELDKYLSKYPNLLGGGSYCIEIAADVRLKLVIGDIIEHLPLLKYGDVDCWFLDGFRPSSNPDMWSKIVFDNMARLSHLAKGGVPATRFATFTSAGFVRRGLVDAGFEVSKIAGFGRKREMSVGFFVGKDVAR